MYANFLVYLNRIYQFNLLNKFENIYMTNLDLKLPKTIDCNK